MKKIILIIIFMININSIYAIKPPIYFVMIDRFSNGDINNDFNVINGNPEAYQGGDIRGIIDKLDYLKSLGVKTLWISPVMDNRDKDFFGAWGYHGYWIKDFFKVDEHFGNMEDLKELVKKAHFKNMYVILDIVLNHTDWDAPYKTEHPDWFHHKGDIKNWDDKTEVEEGNLTGLPDFNQDNNEAYNFLFEIGKFWFKETGCDGFRFDAVKHIPHRFWKKYLKDLRNITGDDFYFLGEILNGDPSTVSEYIDDGFNGVFDFPLYYRLAEVFKNGSSAGKISTILRGDAIYSDKNALNPFLANHDTERFYKETLNIDKYKNALSFIFFIRGMPVIYYGEETPMPQDEIFKSRAPMIFKNNMSLKMHLRRLSDIKNNNRVFIEGHQENIFQTDDLIGIFRYVDNEEAFIFTNVSDNMQTYNFKLPAVSFVKRTEDLRCVYGRGNIRVDGIDMSVSVMPNSTFVIKYISKKHHINIVQKNLININIVVPECKTNWGENVFLSGNTAALGNFDFSKAFGPLTCPNYPEWIGKLKVSNGERTQIRVIVLDSNGKLLRSGKINTITPNKKNQTFRVLF